MKYFLLIFILLACFYTNAQLIFPGYDISILSNQTLKVLPVDSSLQKYGYADFFTDIQLKKNYSWQAPKASRYESLHDKVFTVLNVLPYTNSIDQKKFVLELNNAETGILYYDYDPKHLQLWPFDFVTPPKIPADFFCRDFEVKYDKFTEDTTYYTPMLEGTQFFKIKKGASTNFFLLKNVPGETYSIGKQGAIFLLDNKQRIEKPDARVDVHSTTYGTYYYTTVVALTKQDIELFSNNAITDVRLYIYDTNLKYGKVLTEYFKCLINK